MIRLLSTSRRRPMSRIENAFHNDVHALELLHDELRLQTHLFKAEARKRWDDLETKWGTLKEHLQRLEVAADRNKNEVSSAIKLLVDSLKTGYKDIKYALKP